MLRSVLALLGLTLAIALGGLTKEQALAATPLAHGGNASGVPYFGGQIQNNNYTYYTGERDTRMNSWHAQTGRRYIDAFTAGETMTQYVVYAGSQQDTDLANWFGVNKCSDFNAFGYNVYRSFHFGHDGQIHTSLNRDRQYSVICLNTTSLNNGGVGFDQLDQTSRNRGMTHEMGHSLHLADDSGVGVMNTCFCYDISSSESSLVISTYQSAP